MTDNLDKEYISINTIYESQKKYRGTDLGKKAIRRANERQLLKKMRNIKRSHGGGNSPHCIECGEEKFERLTISKYNDVVLCYSCKYERPKTLEVDEICL